MPHTVTRSIADDWYQARPATGPAGSRRPDPRVFRALYGEFELRTVEGTHVVVPVGTPWFAGRSLGEIARQISEYEQPDANPESGGSPANPR